jgi:uncharacterized protein YicC (UPF0701 family)
VLKALTYRKKLSDDDFQAIISFFEKFSMKYGVGSIAKFDDEVSMRDRVEFYANQAVKFKEVIRNAKISAEVDEALQTYDERRDDESFGLARLTADEKAKIHAHIKVIRKTIEDSELADRKKNALFERLNSLAEEVDLHGTKTDRFFMFLGDAAFVIGEMGKKAKPFLDEVRSMIKVVSRARARQEGISLPPGDEPLMLPSSGGGSDEN